MNDRHLALTNKILWLAAYKQNEQPRNPGKLLVRQPILIAPLGPIDYPVGMEVSQELAERVLQWVGSPNYRPSKTKQIAAGLGIDLDSELRELKRVVKWLVAKRKLRYGPNHLIIGLGEDHTESRSGQSRRLHPRQHSSRSRRRPRLVQPNISLRHDQLRRAFRALARWYTAKLIARDG